MAGAEQVWSAEDYAREGRFVADLAAPLVALLHPRAGERILDLGCGDGALSARLGSSGAEVLGVDSSPDMVAAAQQIGVNAQVLSMEALPFREEFDAVFSNAALHWVRDQDAALAGIFRALKPGGRFVAEMGGHGNIAALRVALRAALSHAGRERLLADEHRENFFPTADDYRARLEAHGFTVETIALLARPTVLGPGGLRAWYRTFRSGVLRALGEPAAEQVLDEAESLIAPVLQDAGGAWIADYVRLRFRAYRPE